MHRNLQKLFPGTQGLKSFMPSKQPPNPIFDEGIEENRALALTAAQWLNWYWLKNWA